MHSLSNEDLLTSWERGRAEPEGVTRALVLLSACYPDVPFSELAELSIGERDALLLAMREQLFGPGMEGRMTCPSCGEVLQIRFNVADVTVGGKRAGAPLRLQTSEYELAFRLPGSRDLLAVRNVAGLEGKRNKLLERVMLGASRAGQHVPYSEIPEQLIAEIEQAMEEADPQADVRLNLRCDVCGRGWQSLFDIGSFLWKELDAWAVRLLREVHALARGYGWRESDILNMRAWRRQCYLEMLGA